MMTGGCLCGGVRYEINGEPVAAGHCHCTACQKATGTGHVSVMVTPRAAVTLTGELKGYVSTGGSGGPITRNFCPTCGSLIYSEGLSMPETINITAGSLDDPSQFKPMFAIYTKERHAWDAPGVTLMEFEAMPPQRSPG